MPTEWGDETLTIVEIDQPLCALTYGNSPCSAQLGVTGTKKCYNTRFTCQDPENYDPDTLTLRFAFPQEDLLLHELLIPCLDKVQTSPLRVNIGSMDKNMSPFGERETVRLSFIDFKHSDLEVDPYRTERPDAHGQSTVNGFEPYAQGTFWSKWLARNPYHEGYTVRVKEGLLGESESSMRVRNYLIDKIDGPSRGQVTVHLKDLFSLIEDRKAEAPVANTGELNADITAVAGSLDLSPSGIGDDEYSNSGHIAINSEIIEFTRATGSDTLTLVTRGALNTEANAHDTEDQVQEVLSYNAMQVDDIVSDLLINYSEVPSDNIPSSEWSTEVANNLPTLYTGHIAQPTPVEDLIAELAEQVGFTFWPDVETDLINLKAIGVNIIPVMTANDDAWVLEDSMDLERDPDLRVSRVQVYFNQINPLEDLEDEKNYRSYVESRDVNAEEATQYGTKSIRKIFSRWIPEGGRATATTIANLILNLFRNPPFRARFELDIQRVNDLSIAFPFAIKTRDLVDDLGFELLNTTLPMSISKGETSLEVEAQKLNLFEPITQERIINIDNHVNNVNMRELHDSLYIPPVDGDEVTFIISSGIVVGGDNLSEPAMTTGEWPDGVILNLQIEAGATLMGPGGNGGNATSAGEEDGTDGGLGLEVLHPLNLTNDGDLGGGGGGGAGDKFTDSEATDFFAGGGGGSGSNNLVNFDQVRGGFRGVVPVGSQPTQYGTDGSLLTPGLGGQAVSQAGGFAEGGDGGLPGQAGQDSQGTGAGAIGGLAGNAIDGDSLVTHLSSSGTIYGAQIN